jgi:hypothetical protein
MVQSKPEADVDKPTVRILVAGEVAPEMLQHIRWGLEEEGIPASQDEVPGNWSAVALAKRAACESRLHVGIGVSGRLQEAALSHRDLPDDKPLLMAAVGPTARDALVGLGKNAARLVKGNPLQLENRIFSESESDVDPRFCPQALERIVSVVVEALTSVSRKVG